MTIPILKFKDVIDSLIAWAKSDYNYYNTLPTPSPQLSWLYDTFYGNVHGNFNYYTGLIDTLTRSDESPLKLETRLMFDTSRAALPTIHIHLPGESSGTFTSIDQSIGLGGLDSNNNRTENKSSSSTSNYELIITGANSEEIIMLYEFIYALFIAGHDTLQHHFPIFKYSGAELMANPDIIPYQTFYRAFKVTVGYERQVRSIVSHSTIESVNFNGKSI